MADDSTLRWGLCFDVCGVASERAKRNAKIEIIFLLSAHAHWLKIECSDDIIFNESKDGELARALECYAHNLCA